MATLYVTEQGARVEKEYGRFIVTANDKVLLAAPAARVTHVVLVGNVGVTTPALLALLKDGIALSLVSRSGELRGQLAPPTGRNLALRQKQYQRMHEPAFCLDVSRVIVEGKLRNYLSLARRLARARPHIGDEQIDRIAACIKKLDKAESVDTARGLEGDGSHAYFSVLRQSLASDLALGPRSRRPPKDPVNALLSLGYTFLSNNLTAACEIVGLDPYGGFFHATAYGRPALALDLMEEFRGVIVDSVVLNMVNRGMLDGDDFEPADGGGVYLRQRAMRSFIEQYTARLNTTVIHPQAQRSLSYQKCFEVQAMQMRRLVMGESARYQPFRTR
jgi:CRISPR-associated protein Cas1